MTYEEEWFECTVCCYASNSGMRADDHEYETGHTTFPAALT